MPALTISPFAVLLLAETHMAEVSLQYREEAAHVDKSGLWWLLIPVIAVGLGIAMYKWWDRAPAAINTPYGMLNELCRAHHLERKGHRLMEKIAQEAELEQPATIFLGRNQFEAAVKIASRRTKFDRRQTATLGMLRRRLFV
ncbi:hypothetical protein N9D23_01500 [Rubripirellula sp.]|jgi:hypothetical protein|nr:hypothetical protein [Rubripirellula sp.]MDF1841356.1 hypothetical protein [Rubripirellula sp.]